MAKFTIECPHCGTLNQASTFIFARKVIKCGNCNTDIDIKSNRLTTRQCPHCKNTVIYDQAKNVNICPACHSNISMGEGKLVSFNCPQCGCGIQTDENTQSTICPVCDHHIENVAKEVAKANLVSDSGVSVIQYEGDNDTLVWKHPIENFNLGSQLIVHESQEAIFFYNGQALDLFGAGRYTLETENLPILKNVYKLPTDSRTPFHAEVYFINKVVQMGMKWGTDSRVRFIDPMTNIPLDIGAYGEMNIQVSDARKLLIKLVGTTNGLSSKELLSTKSDTANEVHKTLRNYFRAPLMTEVKSYLAASIKELNINIFEIDQHLGRLSEALKERVSPKLESYGLTVTEFYISNIGLPEDDKNFKDIKALISQAYIGVKAEEVKTSVAEAARQRQIVEEETRAQLKLIQAQGDANATRVKAMADADVIRATGFAEAEVMKEKGYTEKDVMAADVQKAYAAGMGQMGSGGSAGGGMMSDFVSMMAGMKMADTMFDKMGNMMPGAAPATPAAPSMAENAETWTCSCGESGNTKKFCMNCGKPKPESTDWTCTACGHSHNHGKFCEECGAPKPQNAPSSWICTECGAKENKGNFCAECGAKKPE